GILLSTAHPAPEGPPKHPFINAQAYRSASENEVGALLRQSSSYDGFLQLLLSYGYDLFSVDNGPVPTSISEGYRIAKGNDLVAVVWEHPGQFSNIQQQPEMGQLTSTFASMVVYDAANGSDLMELFNTAKDFEDLLSGIEEARLKLGKV
ncbi:MAG TPA: hypothetical protein VHS96_18455, partial [Bacteroidia bacterium]|nr:hypothetical protein [Bacteroidia bacterium]